MGNINIHLDVSANPTKIPKRPEFVPYADWKLVLKYAKENNIDPHLVAAIGWHETHWGKLGAGLKGYILGYGWPNGVHRIKKFEGFENQIKYATRQIARDLGKEVTAKKLDKFAHTSWKPSVPSAWAKSVYRIYTSLEREEDVEYFTADISGTLTIMISEKFDK